MKMRKDYSKSPAKAFDAVQDIKDYLGQEKFDSVSSDMSKLSLKAFQFHCMLCGIEGFPMEAWYELYHGKGSYAKAIETQMLYDELTDKQNEKKNADHVDGFDRDDLGESQDY